MSFDLNSATKQLKEIELEIKRLNALLRTTRLHKSKIENDIKQYLDHSKHQGVILNNVTIMKEEKLVHTRLKKIEKEEKLKSVLGDSATPELIAKIQNAAKGNQIMKSSISIQYDKM
jgi:pseudouridine-5'-phosphate glycosidase